VEVIQVVDNRETPDESTLSPQQALEASKAARREADHTLANAIVTFAETRAHRQENHWAAKTRELFRGTL
jgi:cation transport ATPase